MLTDKEMCVIRFRKFSTPPTEQVMNFCLTAITPNEQWPFEAITKMAEAFTKANAIEKEISAIAARLVNSPRLNEKYPEMIGELRKLYPAEKLQEELENELAKLTRILNKQGQVELSIEKAKNVRETMANLKTLTPIEQRRFLQAYKGYLERNESSYKEEPLKSALFGDGEILKAEKLTEEIDALDEADLEANWVKMEQYRGFFSINEMILAVMAGSEFQRHTGGTGSNNPLAIGLAYQQAIQAKQMQVQCKAVTSKQEFKEEVLKELTTWNDRYVKYKEAKEISEKFKIALEILNKASSETHSPSLYLDSLCVLSLNSQEMPRYYQRCAIEFAEKIMGHNISQESGGNFSGGGAGCVIS
jgi:hypothetical protein